MENSNIARIPACGDFFHLTANANVKRERSDKVSLVILNSKRPLGESS
jgi:hypothetical protein